MNYQSVRTAIETPFQTNYGALSPAIPVFFDNFYNVLSDSVDEFIHVNIKFGLTTETALTSSHNHIRGIIITRICTEKNKGLSTSSESVTRIHHKHSGYYII